MGLELGGEMVTLFTPQLQGSAFAVTRGGVDSGPGSGGGVRGRAREGWEVRTESRYHKTGNQDHVVSVTFICQATVMSYSDRRVILMTVQ